MSLPCALEAITGHLAACWEPERDCTAEELTPFVANHLAEITDYANYSGERFERIPQLFFIEGRANDTSPL